MRPPASSAADAARQWRRPGLHGVRASVVASGSGSLTVTVDSVLGGQAFLGIPGTYWIHLGNGTNLAVPMPYELTTGVDTALFAFPAQANNQSKAAGSEATARTPSTATSPPGTMLLSIGWLGPRLGQRGIWPL